MLILIILHTIILISILILGIKLIDENNKIKTMENNFYNTINLQGLELMAAIDGVKKQDEKIMIFFNNNQGRSFTPCEVMNTVFTKSTPLTSVRRSMTNLTMTGKLTKTDEQRKGIYGKLNYCWKLNK